jgi:hypothetical protein
MLVVHLSMTFPSPVSSKLDLISYLLLCLFSLRSALLYALSIDSLLHNTSLLSQYDIFGPGKSKLEFELHSSLSSLYLFNLITFKLCT